MAKTKMASGVDTVHPEYCRYVDRWIMVDDVIEGSDQVKSKTTCYLPKPDSHVEKCAPSKDGYILAGGGYDEAAYNYACYYHRQKVINVNTRYGQYLERAFFYNFTKRTKDGMIGGVFRKEPTVELPDNMQYLIDDVDGNGTNLDQQARVVLDQNLRKGRGGLFVDVPAREVGEDGQPIPVSQQDMQNGIALPRIQKYEAQDIINWRTKRIGSVTKVVMIVLREHYEPPAEDEVDMFSHECEYQYRVLYLNDAGNYSQKLYREDNTIIDYGEIRANGRTLDYIPFFFFGSEENDYSVDNAPLYDLAVCNIAHYRNSADNEESSFICGQPTLVLAPSKQLGNPKQFNEANPGGITLGSRQGINVGEGGSAQLLQAAENNLAKQNMRDKEDQAMAIGAQLISPSKQETAEAARIQRGAETAVVAVVTKNVTAAYNDAFKACDLFLGGSGEPDVTFELSTDFFLTMPTAQDRAQWMAEINAGVLPAEFYYTYLRKHGLIPEDTTDEEIRASIETNGTGGLMDGPI